MKIKYKTLLTLLTLTFFLGSCNSGGGVSQVDEFLGTSKDVIEVPTPLSLQITITYPSADGSKVGYQSTVRGGCSHVGKVVQITGDGTGFGVCGVTFTWEATVDFSSAPIGTPSISAKLVDGSTVSGAATRSFVKTSTACDSATARADTYANFSTGGDGGATPWILCTPTQFDNIRLNASHNFVLATDIDLQSTPFNPLPNFTGTLDGDNFVVSNLNINKPGTDNVGLFTLIQNGSTVKNITFDGVTISGRNQVGGIAGQANTAGTSTISNVTVKGTIDGNNNVGGLLGYISTGMDPTISGSTTDVTINGNTNVGGLVGYIINQPVDVTITSSSSAGSLTAAGRIGGAIGYCDSTGTITLTTVSSSASVRATSSDYAGGLIGYLRVGDVTGSSATGDVTSFYANNAAYVGGLIGRANTNSNVESSFATGNVTASGGHTGGLIGYYQGIKLYDSYYQTGTVSIDTTDLAAMNYAGGLVGYMSNGTSGDVQRVFSKGNIVISGDNDFYYVGGVFGRFIGAALDDAYNEGTITQTANVSKNAAYFGGVFGRVDGANGASTTVNNARSSGNITVQGRYAGGWAGYVYKNNQNFDLTITASYSTGNVTSTFQVVDANNNWSSYLGGFAGTIYVHNNGGTLSIQGSYSLGSVTGYNLYIAGFAPYVYIRGTSSFELINSYAAGAVSATDSGNSKMTYISGLIGHVQSDNGAGPMTFTNVHSTSSVTTVGLPGTYVSGLISYIQSGTGFDATFNGPIYTTGNISAEGNYLAGLIANGAFSTNSDVTFTGDVYATGNVTSTGNFGGSDAYIGGLFGNLSTGAGGTITLNGNSQPIGIRSSGSVSVPGENNYIGGLAGRITGGNDSTVTITEASHTGTSVSGGRSYFGGLVGYLYIATGGGGTATVSISNSHATSNLVSTYTGDGYTGGLLGRLGPNSTIERCYTTGNVTTDSRYTGGLVGHLDNNITVRYNYTTGNTESSRDYVGGLVGYTSGTNLTVTGNYTTGNVTQTAGSYAGGFAGYLRGVVTNNFSKGNVFGINHVGGFIGRFRSAAAAGDMDSNYALGTVRRTAGTSTTFGVIAGSQQSAGDVAAGNYYVDAADVVDADGVTSLGNISGLGTSRTNGEMTSGVNGDLPSFTFGVGNGDWKWPVGAYTLADGTANYPYPLLVWMQP